MFSPPPPLTHAPFAEFYANVFSKKEKKAAIYLLEEGIEGDLHVLFLQLVSGRASQRSTATPSETLRHVVRTGHGRFNKRQREALPIS